jgi:hypothetical protein
VEQGFDQRHARDNGPTITASGSPVKLLLDTRKDEVEKRVSTTKPTMHYAMHSAIDSAMHSAIDSRQRHTSQTSSAWTVQREV